MTHPPIHLLRHGETEWNVAGRLQGQGDSPLTVRGRAQAERFGRALARLIDDRIGLKVVASPLGRTLRTAEAIVAALDLPAQALLTDDRLKEISFGAWGGMARAAVIAALGPELAGTGDHDWFLRAPGVETMEALSARVGDFMADLPEARTLIVVSHGITGKVLRGLYLGLGHAEMLRQDEPQDAVYHLAGGKLTRIDVAEALGP